MRSAWPLVGCLAVSVLVASALVCALASFYGSALAATVDSQLARSGTMSVAVSDTTNGRVAAQVAGVRAKLGTAFGTVPYRLYSATWSDSLAVGVPQRSGQVPVIQAAAVGGIAANARLTSGAWPASSRPGRPIPAALPATAATDLGLRTGSVLSVRDLITGRRVSLQVSGLYRPDRPAGMYWQVDLVGSAGVTAGGGFVSYGPAVVSPAAFGSQAGRLAVSELSFVALPRVASINPSQLTPLADQLTAAVASFNSAGQLTATTGMPQTLTNAAAALAAAKSLVLISGLELVLLAATALALASRLLASYREAETALLAARGAGRGQLVRPDLAEAVLAVGVSVVAGAIAGGWLAAALLAGLTGGPLRAATPTGSVWLVAAVLAVFGLSIVVWPAARRPRTARLRPRRGRTLPVATVLAAGLDVALIVLALLAVSELRSYSAAARVASGSGLDPVIVAAPALALAGLAIVPLRLLPIAARGLERLTARGRRLGYAMANWEISRRPIRQAGPAVVVILAVGACTLALAQYQSWRRSVHDQAAFALGAPVRVELGQPEPLAGASRIAGLAPVDAAMPVSPVPLTGSGQLLVLDAALAARTVTLRADLTSMPAARLFQAIESRPAGLVLPGRPARIEITASATGPGARGGTVGAAGIGPVSATLTVQDADGVGYAVATSAMPADGKPHALVARLATAGAAYPLRLVAVSFSYTMPAYPKTARARIADQRDVLQLDGVSVAATADGGGSGGRAPGKPGASWRQVADGQALAGWPAQTADPGLASVIAALSGSTDGAAKPAIDSVTGVGDAERITFLPGHGPLIPQPADGTTAPPPGPAELDLSIPWDQPVPVIASTGFAAANGLRRGTQFAVTIAGEQVTCQLVATVAAFPGGGTLVADQAAVQDALASMGAGGSLPVTQWWLATSTGTPPGGLPAGSTVSDVAAMARRLAQDPVSAAPVHAAALVAAAAALLAALGLCVSVVASARERRPRHALLAALGVPSAAQARFFCLEESLIGIPAAAFGLLLGIGLAHLLVPALTLTATGGLPVPPVLVTIPWGWAIGVAAGLTAIPVLAAAISALRRPDPAADLRATEAAM
jgi:hypothetical protein